MTYTAAQAFMQALETNLIADGNTLNVSARRAFEEDVQAQRDQVPSRRPQSRPHTLARTRHLAGVRSLRRAAARLRRRRSAGMAGRRTHSHKTGDFASARRARGIAFRAAPPHLHIVLPHPAPPLACAVCAVSRVRPFSPPAALRVCPLNPPPPCIRMLGPPCFPVSSGPVSLVVVLSPLR